MLSKTNRIHDALQNLGNELQGADTLTLVLREKVCYFHNFCENTVKMLDKAKLGVSKITGSVCIGFIR